MPLGRANRSIEKLGRKVLILSVGNGFIIRARERK